MSHLRIFGAWRNELLAFLEQNVDHVVAMGEFADLMGRLFRLAAALDRLLRRSFSLLWGLCAFRLFSHLDSNSQNIDEFIN